MSLDQIIPSRWGNVLMLMMELQADTAVPRFSHYESSSDVNPGRASPRPEHRGPFHTESQAGSVGKGFLCGCGSMTSDINHP